MENQTVALKRKRASTTKVKTGCMTCRIRRVKCDEGKPRCTRCLKSGWECDGYSHVKKSQANGPSQRFRILVPSPQQLCRTPATGLFDNDQEQAYFQRYCNYNVTQLTGVRTSELWYRVVLQASNAEPCIRHAVTAIGALDFKNGVGKVDDLEKNRREFAYCEYQKAIVGLRKSIVAKDCDIRTKLLSCILFACFEAYHGNNEIALSQVFTGIEMMEEYSKQRESPKQTPHAPSLAPIDQDIVHSFARLEIQTSAWGDQRNADLHLERMRACSAAVENIPVEFKSLQQAGFMLSMNMLRGIHLRFSQTNRDVLSFSSNIPPFIGLNPCHTAEAVFELDLILSKFRQWNQAFAPLYRKATSEKSKHLLEVATLLRMHGLGSFLWNASGSPCKEMYFRRYTKELKEMVELSKVLIDMVPVASFSLDMMLVLPLAVVGWIYRNRALRREVIDIFSGLTRREAIWDTPMLGKIMEWMTEIEEEGLGDEEYVPEDVVATVANLKVDEAQRSVLVGVLQGVQGEPGKTVFKERTLYW